MQGMLWAVFCATIDASSIPEAAWVSRFMGGSLFKYPSQSVFNLSILPFKPTRVSHSTTGKSDRVRKLFQLQYETMQLAKKTLIV